MPEWIVSALISAGSVLLTLTVTLIFNKVVGLPKILKKRKDQDDLERDQLKQENLIRDQKIAQIEADNKRHKPFFIKCTPFIFISNKYLYTKYHGLPVTSETN